jgi:2-polyprenyl-6-methoxyphenol hydroxylase-like FAD-dependent oxidoreductase
MNILIVGGGIAGLALSRVLPEMDITIVEQAEEFKPVGAGIMLHANATAIMQAMGLGDELHQRGRVMESIVVTDQHGRSLSASDMESMPLPSYAIHRADLHDLLLAANPHATIHLGESVTEMTQQDEQVMVTFTSGHQATYELVVGADGVNSIVRRMHFPDIEPVYSGYTCWRVVVDSTLGLSTPAEMWGKGARLGLVPLPGDRLYSFMVKNAPPNAPEPDSLREAFAEFDTPLFDAINPETPILRHDLDYLSGTAWYTGRVVLVGDAAHAMTPNLGQGAAQAIESAWVLGRALLNKEPLKDTLAHYQAVRQPRVEALIKRSNMLGRVGQFPHLTRVRNALMRVLPGEGVFQQIVQPGIDLAK